MWKCVFIRGFSTLKTSVAEWQHSLTETVSAAACVDPASIFTLLSFRRVMCSRCGDNFYTIKYYERSYRTNVVSLVTITTIQLHPFYTYATELAPKTKFYSAIWPENEKPKIVFFPNSLLSLVFQPFLTMNEWTMQLRQPQYYSPFTRMIISFLCHTIHTMCVCRIDDTPTFSTKVSVSNFHVCWGLSNIFHCFADSKRMRMWVCDVRRQLMRNIFPIFLASECFRVDERDFFLLFSSSSQNFFMFHCLDYMSYVRWAVKRTGYIIANAFLWIYDCLCWSWGCCVTLGCVVIPTTQNYYLFIHSYECENLALSELGGIGVLFVLCLCQRLA